MKSVRNRAAGTQTGRIAIVLAGILSVYAMPAAAAEFTRSLINLPAATTAFETRFDLDGDGLGDVISVFQRRILIFFQTPKGSFPIAPDVEIGAGSPIPDDYAAVTVARSPDKPGMQLILIGPRGADAIALADLKGRPSQPIEPVPLIQRRFSISAEPTLQFLDVAVDVDGDGRSELLLPNGDQLEIYSLGSGGYTLSSKIYLPLQTVQQTALRGEPPLMGSPFNFDAYDAGALVRSLPRLNRWLGIQFAVVNYGQPFLLTDFNQDRRLDLIASDRVLYQNQAGKFEAVTGDVYSRIASALALSRNRVSSLPTADDFVIAPNLVDFNGDGRLDTFRVEASAAKLSPRTDVSIFLGKEDRSIPEQPNFVLRTRDVAYSEMIPIGDINKDGAQDIALFHLDFQPSSASSQLKAYLRSGLEGELRFYLWDKKNNRFPDDYAFSYPLVVNYEIFGARQLFRQQVVMSQDMDGDRFPDLVLKTGPQQISILHNDNGKKFDSKSAAVISTSPTRFSSLAVKDLNGDGKGDIVVSGYTDQHEDRIIYSLFVSR